MNQLDQRRRAQRHANIPYANGAGAVVPFRGGPPGPVAPCRDVMPPRHRGNGGGRLPIVDFDTAQGPGYGGGRAPGWGHGHGHGHGHGRSWSNGHGHGYGHGHGHGYDRDAEANPWSPFPFPIPIPGGDVRSYGDKRPVGPPHRRDVQNRHDHRVAAHTPFDDIAHGSSINSNREHSRHGQHGSRNQYESLTDPHRELPPYREGGDTKALTSDLAVVRVVEWLSSDAGKKEAIRALDNARAYVRQDNPDWETVPFALWSTLDNGLFKGRLSPAVYLEWADAREYGADTIGQTFAPGKLETRSGGTVERIGIQLNPNFFAARAKNDSNSEREPGRVPTIGAGAGDLLIAALIHQMAHAWFLRACGPQKKASTADHRLKHADGFWKMLHCIAELSRQTQIDKHAGTAARFADTLVRAVHAPLRREGEGWHMPREVQAQMDAECFEHTVCHACVVERRSKEDADAWYKKVAGPAKEATSDSVYAFDADAGEAKATPRHEKGSPVSYLEVVWDKKAFDYRRKSVERDFASIKARLAAGKRVLTLPRGVDAATFAVLDSFLKSGSEYKPSFPTPIHAGVPLLAPPFKKPPRPDPLWIDVRAFKLGTALDLPELADAASARLHAQRTLHSSPLDALAEIYASPALTTAYPHTGAKSNATCAALDTAAPHDALRAWARRLMLATKAGSADGGYYASNLCAIERHCGGAGVQGLVASSQSLELEQDYSLCLTQLWERTPASMHPPGGGVRGGGGAAWVRRLPVHVRHAGPDTQLVVENSDIRHRLREIERENEELRGWERQGRAGRRRSRSRSRSRSRDAYRSERRPWSYRGSSGSDSEDDGRDRLVRALEALEAYARRHGWSRIEIDDETRRIEREYRCRRTEPSYRH